MTIHSEQHCYRGQSWPCYGVHPVDRGLGLGFQAWCFDGARVYWGPVFELHSDAMAHARQIASES